MAGGAIEIYFTLFGSFSKYDTIHAGKMDILSVQPDQFTDTHPGRVKEFNECKIPFLLTGTAQNFPFFVRQWLFDAFLIFDAVQSCSRIVDNMFLLLEPGKEAVENDTLSVQISVSDLALIFIDGEICEEIICSNVLNRFLDGVKHQAKLQAIMSQSFLGTASHTQRGQVNK